MSFFKNLFGKKDEEISSSSSSPNTTTISSSLSSSSSPSTSATINFGDDFHITQTSISHPTKNLIAVSGSSVSDASIQIYDSNHLNHNRLSVATKIDSHKSHKSPIRCCCFDYTGKYIASGSWSQSLVIFNIESKKIITNVPNAHSSSIYCVKWLRCGIVISASHDGTMKLWNVGSSTARATLTHAESSISSSRPQINHICLNSDETLLVSVATDKNAVVWSKTINSVSGPSFNRKKTFSNCSDSALKSCCFVSHSVFAVCDEKSHILLFDASTGGSLSSAIKIETGFTGQVETLSHSSLYGVLSAGSLTNEVRLFDLSSIIASDLSSSSSKKKTIVASNVISFARAVYNVTHSPDGSVLFVCSMDGKLYQYDAKTGVSLGPSYTYASGNGFWCCSVSQTGEKLALGCQNQEMLLLNIAGVLPAPVATLPAEGSVVGFKSFDDQHLTYHVSNTRIVKKAKVPQNLLGGRNTPAYLASTATTTSTSTQNTAAASASASSTTISPTLANNALLGSLVISGGSNNNVTAVARGTHIQLLQNQTNSGGNSKPLENSVVSFTHNPMNSPLKWIAITDNGQRAAAGGWSDHVAIFDLNISPQQQQQQQQQNKPTFNGLCKGHSDTTYQGEFLSDSYHLLTCSHDKTIKIWNTFSKHCVSTLNEGQQQPHKHDLYTVAINDSNKMIVSGDSSGVAVFWTRSLSGAMSFHKTAQIEHADSPIRSICFNPSIGDIAAICGGKKVTIYKTHPTITKIHVMTLSSSIEAAAWSLGNIICVGTNDTINFFDGQSSNSSSNINSSSSTTNEKYPALGLPHQIRSTVHSLQFSRDASTLFVCDMKGTISALAPVTGTERGKSFELSTCQGIWDFKLTPNQDQIIFVAQDGNMRMISPISDLPQPKIGQSLFTTDGIVAALTGISSDCSLLSFITVAGENKQIKISQASSSSSSSSSSPAARSPTTTTTSATTTSPTTTTTSSSSSSPNNNNNVINTDPIQKILPNSIRTKDMIVMSRGTELQFFDLPAVSNNNNSPSNNNNNFQNPVVGFPLAKVSPLQSTSELGAPVKFLCFSRCGTFVAGCGWSNNILLYNVKKSTSTRLTGHTDSIYCVLFDKSGNLISASYDKTVKIWDCTSKTVITTLNFHSSHVNCVSLSYSESLLATASSDKTVVLASRTAPNKYSKLHTFTNHVKNVKVVAISPDEKIVASAGDEFTIFLHSTSAALSYANLGILRNHTNSVESLAWCPTGIPLLVSGSLDNSVRFWNTKTKTQLGGAVDHSRAVYNVSFDETGSCLFTSCMNGQIRCISVECVEDSPSNAVALAAGRIAQFRTLGAPYNLSSSQGIWSVSFEPKSHVIACATQSGKIELLHLGTTYASASSFPLPRPRTPAPIVCSSKITELVGLVKNYSELIYKNAASLTETKTVKVPVRGSVAQKLFGSTSSPNNAAATSGSSNNAHSPTTSSQHSSPPTPIISSPNIISTTTPNASSSCQNCQQLQQKLDDEKAARASSEAKNVKLSADLATGAQRIQNNAGDNEQMQMDLAIALSENTSLHVQVKELQEKNAQLEKEKEVEEKKRKEIEEKLKEFSEKQKQQELERFKQEWNSRSNQQHFSKLLVGDESTMKKIVESVTSSSSSSSSSNSKNKNNNNQESEEAAALDDIIIIQDSQKQLRELLLPESGLLNIAQKFEQEVNLSNDTLLSSIENLKENLKSTQLREARDTAAKLFLKTFSEFETAMKPLVGTLTNSSFSLSAGSSNSSFTNATATAAAAASAASSAPRNNSNNAAAASSSSASIISYLGSIADTIMSRLMKRDAACLDQEEEEDSDSEVFVEIFGCLMESEKSLTSAASLAKSASPRDPSRNGGLVSAALDESLFGTVNAVQLVLSHIQALQSSFKRLFNFKTKVSTAVEEITETQEKYEELLEDLEAAEIELVKIKRKRGLDETEKEAATKKILLSASSVRRKQGIVLSKLVRFVALMYPEHGEDLTEQMQQLTESDGIISQEICWDSYCDHERIATAGEGARHNLYLATNPSDGKRYALKQYDLDERFYREVRLMSRLGHCFVMPVISAFTRFDDVSPAGFLVMPFVEGKTFDIWANKHREQPHQIMRVLHNVLEAVAHIHSNGVIHADLKDINVLMSDDSPEAVPMLCDFDASKDTAALGQHLVATAAATRISATIKYASPEVLEIVTGTNTAAAIDYTNITTALDIWSFAVLFMSIKDPSFSVQPGIQPKIPTSNKNFSEDEKDLLSQMFQQDPKKRITASAALHHPSFNLAAQAAAHELQLKQREEQLKKQQHAAPFHWKNSLDIAAPQKVEISSTETRFKQIQELFDKTCLTQFIGIGRDSHGLKHKGYKVKKVFHLEHPDLWKKYVVTRDAIARKRKHESLPKLPGLEHFDWAQKELQLRSDANELLLFHGLKGTGGIADIIVRDGFDPRLSADAGLSGAGNYGAMNSSKSDEYCTPGADGLCPMFLVRYTMGSFYKSTKLLNNIRRPPCLEFGHTKPCEHEICDSVLSVCKRSGFTNAYLQRYDEFIVYDDAQVYPEYLVYFERTK